jgi:hypothetical protein
MRHPLCGGVHLRIRQGAVEWAQSVPELMPASYVAAKGLGRVPVTGLGQDVTTVSFDASEFHGHRRQATQLAVHGPGKRSYASSSYHISVRCSTPSNGQCFSSRLYTRWSLSIMNLHCYNTTLPKAAYLLRCKRDHRVAWPIIHVTGRDVCIFGVYVPGTQESEFEPEFLCAASWIHHRRKSGTQFDSPRRSIW